MPLEKKMINLFVQKQQRKNNYDLIDETIVKVEQFTKVAPGEYQQFEATKDTVAFELYWAELDHDDIESEPVGFSK